MATGTLPAQSAESVSITPVSSVIAFGNKIGCVRAGKVVQITFWENQALSTNGIAITGVPKAKTNATALITKGGVSSYETLGTVYIQAGETDVHILCKSTNTPLYGELVYICE